MYVLTLLWAGQKSDTGLRRAKVRCRQGSIPLCSLQVWSFPCLFRLPRPPTLHGSQPLFSSFKGGRLAPLWYSLVLFPHLSCSSPPLSGPLWFHWIHLISTGYSPLLVSWQQSWFQLQPSFCFAWCVHRFWGWVYGDPWEAIISLTSTACLPSSTSAEKLEAFLTPSPMHATQDYLP